MPKESHKSKRGYFGETAIPRRASLRDDPERRKDCILALLWVNQRLAECETEPLSRRRVEALTREKLRLETAIGSEGASRL